MAKAILRLQRHYIELGAADTWGFFRAIRQLHEELAKSHEAQSRPRPSVQEVLPARPSMVPG